MSEEEIKKIKCIHLADRRATDKLCPAIEELKKEKEKNKELNLENQALYESINLNDDTTLAKLYHKEKEKNDLLENVNYYLTSKPIIFQDKIKDKIKWYKEALNYDCNGLEDTYKLISEVLEELLKENKI